MPEQAEREKTKILLIDDDPVIGRLIERGLGGQYEIRVLSNGVEAALELDRFGPDLIILDGSLPWVSGIDLCHLIRGHVSYQKTPIIFLSGRHEFMDMMAAMQAGANRYLSKPVVIENLNTVIRSLLGKETSVSI